MATLLSKTLKVSLVGCLFFFSFNFNVDFTRAALNPNLTDLEVVTAILDPVDPVVGESVAIAFLILNNGTESLIDSRRFSFAVTSPDFIVEYSEPLLPPPDADNPFYSGDINYYMLSDYFTSAGEKIINFTIDSDNELSEFDESNSTISKVVVSEISDDDQVGADQQIISEIKQIQTALELYFNDYSRYPPAIVGGNKLGVDATCLGQDGFARECPSTSVRYMGEIPHHPKSPKNDYKYHSCGKDDYIVEFFLENNYSSLTSGVNYATPNGLSSKLDQADFFTKFDLNKCLNDEIVEPDFATTYGIKPGLLVKNKKFAEVFYVDDNMKLRWVVNEQTAIKYFGQTWTQQVKEFDDLEKSGLEFGESITENNFLAPIMPDSYSDIKTAWLVKDKKNAEVFYVDGDMKLRWINSEYTATQLFGTNWAQQVKEFNDLTLSGLEFGDSLDFSKNSILDFDGDGLLDSDEIKYGTDPHSTDTDRDGFNDAMEVRSGFNPLIPAVSDSDYIKGDRDAKITLIVYSDFQCPYCAKLAQTIDALLAEYPEKVRSVYRHFISEKAAEAFECAGEQGKAYEMHDLLFKNQTALEVADLKIYAGQLGLNQIQFDRCLDEDKYADKINKQARDARTSGITGTPSTWINNQLIRGAYPVYTFEEIINDLLR